jgi:beta-galactosidase GanA
MLIVRCLSVALLATLFAVAMPGASSTAAAKSHSITYDRHSLMIDGKRVYVWSGEFHYWRLPSPDAWRDVLEKIHAAGFNAVSIYFDWGYHSVAPHEYDFTGVRDADKLLDIASQVGIYVIARPGPYINAETDSGGFPGWLQNIKGPARTSAPDYLSAALEWFGKIDPIIARHQLTNGTGTVILYQVENEYGGDDVDRNYMAALERKVRDDGITVPLTHNSCCGDQGRWAKGVGAVDINGYDEYPQGFDCTHPNRWSSLPERSLPRARVAAGDNKPLFLLEYQGGAYDPWSGPGYEACRKLIDAKFERVFEQFNLAQGATAQNFYMAYGGTSWGWLPTPAEVYTSYDYAAIIDEARRLSEKYGEQKLLANEVRTLRPLLTSVPEAAPAISNGALHLDARVDPSTKTQFFFVRHVQIASTLDDRGTFLATIGDRRYAIPVRIDGRDSKIVVANFPLGDARVIYSTSEIVTQTRVGNRDVALLFGRAGESGRTVVRFPDGADRVLNYRHGSLQRILLAPARRGDSPLELLVASDAVAAKFWPCSIAGGTILVRGPYLLRGCSIAGARLALTGDTTAPTGIEIFAPLRTSSVSWNGEPIAVRQTADQTLAAEVAGPMPVSLPALVQWRFRAGSPESDPGFDDTGWTRADRGALYADPYDFHYGEVWYRGRFIAAGSEKTLAVDAITGVGGAYSVWLNGTFLGSQEADKDGRAQQKFDIPAGVLKSGKDNVLAILLENSGHEEDGTRDDYYKTPRGLGSVKFVGPNPEVAWRLQGNLEDDAVRGPMNTGGLFGERNGWYLPGFPDSSWQRGAAGSAPRRAGVTWYRTTFALHVPHDQDTSIALQIDDTNDSEYRAQIYLNGWLIGRYVNDLGPETRFILPNGILRTDGNNTLAIASWKLDPQSGNDLGILSLRLLSNTLTPLHISDVYSPGYARLFHQ